MEIFGDQDDAGHIVYWRKGESVQNFGDFLAPYIKVRSLSASIVPHSNVWLIGSVIDDTIIDNVLPKSTDDLKSLPLVFWCCGMRGDQPLRTPNKVMCRFLGIRGPLSRDALGLPIDTPLGDPGLLLPILYSPSPARHAGKIIAIPHFCEARGDEELKNLSGVDVILRPALETFSDIENLINEIAAARLVLCGSLHAAITAFAYNVPFAYWDTGFIDTPFKWHDFSALINVESRWVKSAEEAVSHPLDVSRSWKPAMTSLLSCCPFAVKPAVLARAIAHDIGLDARQSARMDELIGEMESRFPS